MSEFLKSIRNKVDKFTGKAKDVLLMDISTPVILKAREKAIALAKRLEATPRNDGNYLKTRENLKNIMMNVGIPAAVVGAVFALNSEVRAADIAAMMEKHGVAPTELTSTTSIQARESITPIEAPDKFVPIESAGAPTPIEAPDKFVPVEPTTQVAPTIPEPVASVQKEVIPPVALPQVATQQVKSFGNVPTTEQVISPMTENPVIIKTAVSQRDMEVLKKQAEVENPQSRPAVAPSVLKGYVEESKVASQLKEQAQATSKFTILAPTDAQVGERVEASAHFAKGQSERSLKTADQLSSFIPTPGEYALIKTILIGKELGGDPNQLVADPYNLQTKTTRGELYKKAIQDPNFQEVVRKAYDQGNIEVATHQTTSELTRSFDVLGSVIGLLTGKVAIGFGSKDTGSATTVFQTQETNQYIASATPKSLLGDITSLVGQLEAQKLKSTSPKEQKQLNEQIATLSTEKNRIEKDQEGVAGYIRLAQLKNQGTLSARESSELKDLTQNLIGGTKEVLPPTGALEYVTQPFGNLSINTVKYTTRVTTSYGSISIDVNSPLARALKNHDPKTPLSNTLLLQISDEMQKQNPNSENFGVIRSVGTSDQINRRIINKKLNNVRVSYTKPGDILPSPDKLSDGQNAMGAVIAIAKDRYLRGDIKVGDQTLSYIFDSTGRIHPDAEAFLNTMGVKSSNLSRSTIMSLQVRADNRAGLGDRIRSIADRVAELERIYQEADSRAMESADPRHPNHKANKLAKEQAWNARQVELGKIRSQLTAPLDATHTNLLNFLGIETTTTMSGKSDGARDREIKLESASPVKLSELRDLRERLKGAKTTVVLDERTSNFFGFQIVNEKYDGQANTQKVNEKNVKVGNLFIEALHAILPVGLSFKTTDKISESGTMIKTPDYASLRDGAGALALTQNSELAAKILSYSKTGLSFDLATHRAITDLYGINNNIVKMTVNVNSQKQEINIPLSELPQVVKAYQGAIVKTTFSSPTATTGMPGVQLLGNQIRAISSTTAVDLTPEVRKSLENSSNEAVRNHIKTLQSTRLESVTQKGSKEGTLTEMYQEMNQRLGINLPIPTGNMLTKWRVNGGQESVAKVDASKVQVRYNVDQMVAQYKATKNFRGIFQMLHCTNDGCSLEGAFNLSLALEEAFNIKPITTQKVGGDVQYSRQTDNTKATATIPKGSEPKKPNEPKQPTPEKPVPKTPDAPKVVNVGNSTVVTPVTPAVTPPGQAGIPGNPNTIVGPSQVNVPVVPGATVPANPSVAPNTSTGVSLPGQTVNAPNVVPVAQPGIPGTNFNNLPGVAPISPVSPVIPTTPTVPTVTPTPITFPSLTPPPVINIPAIPGNVLPVTPNLPRINFGDSDLINGVAPIAPVLP